MRRGIGVYERLVKRFTAQTTDYQSLLSTFAEGLYTEMDFRNEAFNAQRMQRLLREAEFGRSEDIHIPQPVMEYTTRCGGLISGFRVPGCSRPGPIANFNFSDDGHTLQLIVEDTTLCVVGSCKEHP